MTVKTILQGKGHEVVSIPVGTKMREAVALLADKRIGAVPVTDGASVAGILSERDVIYCLASDGAALLDWNVERIMTAPAITVTPDVPVLSALSQMSRRRIRHLPVVEEGRLVGIVSIGDLVAYRIRRIEEEAEAMRIYIQSV
ncbi:CBS domain-containing protein [Sphingosinicella rhizophila]|uniref:CBS domain-containing protein n=1 Tax=Sphingosinicella rhizophila TaxID=3050082 RepID=A0ABU3QBY4_9SPHN|nr:CBS domain-containing protein [Sphingosinicella sp. GR2756]MDT9600899.1 CBS domain-containing protein [Sphingosinicella sp. GR2756]